MINNLKYFFLIGLFGVLFAQETANDASIVFDNVKVNNVLYNGDEIIITDTDTISFEYFARVDDALKDDPFLFKVSLENSFDKATKDWNEPTTIYSNLPEDNYIFTVSAFDLQRRWQTDDLQIKFTVNNSQARMMKEIVDLKDKIIVKDTLINSLRENASSEDKAESSGNVWIYFGAGFLSGIILFFLVYMFLLPKGASNDKKKKRSKSSVPELDPNRLKLENDELKDEVSKLNSQMEQLQEKTEDMRSQNRELEENVRKLSNTKEELENLQNQKDELFAMLIHDIKNPAGIIKSLVELLRSYDLSAIDQQKIIEDIINTTSKIMSLSNEVARVLALESGQLMMGFEPTTISKLSRDIFDRFMVKAKEKSILMMFEVPSDLPEIQADESRLDEVLSNLVSNAIKFTQKGGTVRMKGQVIDDSIVIEISDNGQGLSQDDLLNAFKKGAQLSARPTAGESSTGLGLWIVKKLVEAHNGRVWVRSSLGKGSTFAFSLPLKQSDSTGIVKL